MYTVVKVTIAAISDHCPFYKVGDTFFIKQQCFDPGLASPRQFCIHSFKDIYGVFCEVRSGPVGNKKTAGCMDKGIVTFELERLADEQGTGWR